MEYEYIHRSLFNHLSVGNRARKALPMKIQRPEVPDRILFCGPSLETVPSPCQSRILASEDKQYTIITKSLLN